VPRPPRWPAAAGTERTDADVLAGPREGFGQLFERYSAVLYGYCARRVGADLAEDLVAETFLTAFERRDRFDPAAPTARPWLFGIVTNLLRNHLRTEKRAWKALGTRAACATAGPAPPHAGVPCRAAHRPGPTPRPAAPDGQGRGKHQVVD